MSRQVRLIPTTRSRRGYTSMQSTIDAFKKQNTANTETISNQNAIIQSEREEKAIIKKENELLQRKIALLEQKTKMKFGEIDDRNLQCRICKKIFGNNYNLKRHMRIHSGAKPFKCTYCLKLFGRHDNLQTHIRIHTRDRPFTCNACFKSFTSKSNLNRHCKKSCKKSCKRNLSRYLFKL
eukprot:131144_1